MEMVLKLLIDDMRINCWMDLSFLIHQSLMMASNHIGTAYRNKGTTITWSSLAVIFLLASHVKRQNCLSSITFLSHLICWESTCFFQLSFLSRTIPRYLTSDFGETTVSLTKIDRLVCGFRFLVNVLSSVFGP